MGGGGVEMKRTMDSSVAWLVAFATGRLTGRLVSLALAILAIVACGQGPGGGSGPGY
jgi:hypothetical protein